MPTATVLQFMHKTAEDETLRQQLETLLGAGDGNISSKTELDPTESEALKGRAPVVAQFATQNGFAFSVEELIAVVSAFEKHQTGELSDRDFAALVGVPTSKGTSNNLAFVTKPLKRLARYMGKTYLGVTIPE